MKRCTACGEAKPLSAFYRNGRDPLCKPCKCAQVRAYRLANLERVRAYDRQRGSRVTTEKQRENRSRYPDKYRARTAVGNAIRDGRLIREDCEACGSHENVHAHHEDYSKPLDVRWLCRECHWQEHRHAGT